MTNKELERFNEDALERFADLLEPISEIAADSEVMSEKGSLAKIAAKAIKRHKQAVIQILAISDGEPVEGYKVNAFTIPFKLVNLMNRPEFKDLFTSQGQKTDEEPSGSAMDDTRDGAH